MKTQEIEFWKQKINTEQRQVKHQTAADILKNSQYINSKNCYIQNFKHDKGLMEQTARDTATRFVFDQVMMDTELKSGPGAGVIRNKNLDAGFNDPEKQHGYVQKSKHEGIWNKYVKPREHPKSVQQVPLTSAQVIGWREPIDNLMQMGHPNVHRSGICHRTFHDNGHL